MSQKTIMSSFNDYFNLILADKPELLRQVYQIRYQVYCQEFHYEQEAHFPERLEQDKFDEHSLHCLMVHRETQQPVGCIRLITPRQDDLHAALPFEAFCTPAANHQINPSQLPRGSFGEFSRLAVTSNFRRRQEDEKKPIGIPADTQHDPTGRRSDFPFIPVGLFMAGMAMFLNTSMQCAFAMMEPRLVRLLRRFGIIFTQVGEVIDYHGSRAAFVLMRETAAASLRPEVHDLLEFIDQQLFGEERGPRLTNPGLS